MKQLYVHRYHLFSGLPSHLGHHRALSRVPCVYSRFSLVIYFTTDAMYKIECFLSKSTIILNLGIYGKDVEKKSLKINTCFLSTKRMGYKTETFFKFMKWFSHSSLGGL